MKFFRMVKFLALASLLAWSAASLAADSEYWGFCSNGKAFSDEGMTNPKPEADWVCQAPTADQTGEAIERNTLRCLLDQKQSCQVGAGGAADVRGDHNVPRGAWYWIPGASEQYPDVRCECGCFTGDVKVLTHLGYMRMDEASKNASSLGGLSMAVFSAETDGYRGSARLTNKDFVVGPEEKPIVRVRTSADRTLTMTDGHPVLILKGGDWTMVRAGDLSFGDTVLSAQGGLDHVTALSSEVLPESERLVYNFDTKGLTDQEHIIVANDIRTGDLHWQKRLSEQNSRSENLLKFAQQ